MKYLLLCISLLFSTFSFSAPNAELWDYWNRADEQNTQAISHLKWQYFLDNYLVEKKENTLVRYKHVTPSDKQQLKSYISDMAKLDPRTYNKAEQYAYWVNLYNALTVNVILDNYPIKSITKLGGLFSFGPWGDEIVVVTDKKLSLNDIEHRILRPIWQDARTHYAVNCASLGCPNLQPVAFDAMNQEMLLEQAAGSFINSGKGVKQSGNKTVLSSIYEWFPEDFGSKQALTNHLKKYRPTLSLNLDKVKYDYNWDLNEAK